MQVFEKMTYKHSVCVCVSVCVCTRVSVHMRATHIGVNVFITAGRIEIMNLFHSGIPLKKKKNYLSVREMEYFCEIQRCSLLK